MSEEKYDLPRSLYKEIKNMNREQMQNIITNIYNQGVQDAGVSDVDLDQLRKEIGQINGIGEKRLDEIMAVIEKFMGDDHK